MGKFFTDKENKYIENIVERVGYKNSKHVFKDNPEVLPVLTKVVNSRAKSHNYNFYKDKDRLLNMIIKYHPNTWYDEGVLYSETPYGQVSYHIFDDTVKRAKKYSLGRETREWVGHNREKSADDLMMEVINDHVSKGSSDTKFIKKANMSIMSKYFEKIALNAAKARELAKSVGLVPHHESDWKWALRNLRAKNPEGIKNAPLMLEGKELAKAKEKLGKLPNNDFQQMKALQRKQKLGVEVGGTKVSENHKLVTTVGERGGVGNAGINTWRWFQSVKNNYNPKKIEKLWPGLTKKHTEEEIKNVVLKGAADYYKLSPPQIHTHPEFNKIVNKQLSNSKYNKYNPKEYARMGDRTLFASPSGMDKNNPIRSGGTRGDYESMLGGQNHKENFTIISPETQGVHKFRDIDSKKKRMRLRSLYFDGGLNG